MSYQIPSTDFSHHHDIPASSSYHWSTLYSTSFALAGAHHQLLLLRTHWNGVLLEACLHTLALDDLGHFELSCVLELRQLYAMLTWRDDLDLIKALGLHEAVAHGILVDEINSTLVNRINIFSSIWDHHIGYQSEILSRWGDLSGAAVRECWFCIALVLSTMGLWQRKWDCWWWSRWWSWWSGIGIVILQHNTFKAIKQLMSGARWWNFNRTIRDPPTIDQPV